MTSPYCLRRATTAVLVAVALIGGAILFLGGRFDAGQAGALAQTVQAGAPIAACVAEENMRLITLDRDRCQPGELELAAGRADPARPDGPPAGDPIVPATAGLAAALSGPPGPPGPPGVSGFAFVTARLTVAAKQTAAGEARCPAGKVAVGGGALPDPEGADRSGAEHRVQLAISGPLLPAGDRGSGWTVTVRNLGSPPLQLVVAAICVELR
ncbi:MAG TPA: hypothetical protein VFS16_12265 [Acidimicrobiia bacterium]|nr:hypothetical protein [Acidimicrobiia bacterium]